MLAGIVLARLGADVLLTDLEPNLPLLAHNCTANGMQPTCTIRLTTHWPCLTLVCGCLHLDSDITSLLSGTQAMLQLRAYS